MTLAGELVLRVDPDSDGAALTGRATPPRLRFGVAAQGQVFMAAGAAQVASVLPRLARAAPGRRLRIQPQVGEDLLDDLPLEDGCDDLQFPGAAVRAVLHVDVEDALEKPRPADAVRPGLDSLDFALGNGCSLGGHLCLRRWAVRHYQRAQLRVRGQHAVEPDEVQPRPRHQRRKPLHELKLAHDQVRGAVAPRRLKLEVHLPRGVELDRSSDSAGRVM
ncbi:Uncharacterised protein [Pseudomonas luteola]|uniref:Uncharacterized protein n=2 Tax=Pseudomonas TaxID=286 RepID=A0A2X2CYM2_PSELU|nr:hypothetical protein SAMN05216409_12311 [Pseudomonas lutea]SPZ05055.1 Uncharacterised protein [Pseudomonas luteola]